ncbi:cytochrome c-type biogenesis protein CcmH [Nitratireductor kimnyeongensis]|uniref:Cytochrome c-type biogenesis protein n=1 Tax=Nitratireductor kimnyeongensis TaxID=430679 RepID=A0ABW0T3M8_9HYPH|nr:cytochrome c-type biogenesis protein [Nitratireductor kimnyeongensis]QZZ35024.1 cytochrome c-type biogenesis protein CcmH [Nitratireductor kimnyeongensis]
MRRLFIGALTAALGLLNLALQPVLAVQPDEILDNPVLEARARALSAELRCMVCQNQSIDDSDAELARDLRVLVRERLKTGDSNEEVIAYVVDRYGEFVLLKPRFSYRNALLWGAPVILLAMGGVLIVTSARRRKADGVVSSLSAEEKKRLDQILNERE